MLKANCKPTKNERGVALIGVVLALLIITVVGIGISLLGLMNVTAGTNVRLGSEAFYLADTGITHARRLIRVRVQNDFDVVLQSGNGIACDGDELAAIPPGLTAADTIATAANGGQQFPPAGRYEVRVCDDDAAEAAATADPPDLPDNNPNDDKNRRIRMLATGFGRDNSTATIEMFISAQALPAVIVDGNARMNGNPSIMGGAGAIHANGSLELPGNPCAQEYFSASGSINGDGQGGASCRRGQADYRPGSELINVPVLNPADFVALSNYRMNAQTCAVTNAAGVLLNVPADKKWGKWDCDPGSRFWKFSGNGNQILPGTYYSTGSISISGSPGSPAAPIPLTLIAEGWVDLSGNPNLAPALSQNGTNYSVIAGTDLKIGGNPGVPYSGVLYARDQIDFSGNPALNAQVLAANEGDLPAPNPGGINLVQLKAGGFMEVSGNAIINYNGGGLVTISMDGWRECRGLNPGDPCQ